MSPGQVRVDSRKKSGQWSGTRRSPTTPQPVWVYLPRVLPPARIGGRHGVPLRVRASGLDNSATVLGILHAWHQTHTGDWYALTSFEITNRNGTASLVTTQLVTADAVRPR